jgi:hypothetical protein
MQNKTKQPKYFSNQELEFVVCLLIVTRTEELFGVVGEL